jgi:hypothetical protein
VDVGTTIDVRGPRDKEKPQTIHTVEVVRAWHQPNRKSPRRLFVVVDDSTAAYGMLRIVYADCQ